MIDLDNLSKEIVEFRKKRGWGKSSQVAPKNLAIGLLLEAAEFLEVFEWTKGNGVPKGKREDLEDELIDVLYWVLVIAHDLKIDLKKTFKRKMKKNKLKYPVEKKNSK